MRRAFTLIELILATMLAALLFFYLYSVIDSLKLQNEPYVKKVKTTLQETITFDLVLQDFIQHRGKIEVTAGRKFDFVKFRTINSLHNLYEPYVYYFVSKNNNTLIRTEAPKSIDINSDLWGQIYFSDIVLEEISSFKIKHHQDFLNLMILGDKITPIILKVFVGE
jgi:prepilin-type N-terminal cleavage/methylation domain-containing protein